MPKVRIYEQETLEIEVTCEQCKKNTILKVPTLGYNKWLDGSLIQDVMPELSTDERELLISGICGKCFDKMFKEATEGQLSHAALESINRVQRLYDALNIEFKLLANLVQTDTNGKLSMCNCTPPNIQLYKMPGSGTNEEILDIVTSMADNCEVKERCQHGNNTHYVLQINGITTTIVLENEEAK